jgi:hypothetical protein
MHPAIANPNKALWEKGDFTRLRHSCANPEKQSLSRWDNAAATGFGPGLRRRHHGDSLGPLGG